MRAHEFLFEHVDQRSTAQKLHDMINHPSTEPAVREVARKKLEVLLTQNPDLVLITEPVLPPVQSNLSFAEMDRPFMVGVQIRDLYDRLASLSPRPSLIYFLRQGQINLMVPPPYMGVSKTQYLDSLRQAAPGVRAISSQFVEDKGYFFSLSFL